MDEWIRIRECLTDAGCGEAAIRRAEGLYRSGRAEDLIRCLRSFRYEVLEEIHEKQKRLDRLDMLIRETKNGKGE